MKKITRRAAVAYVLKRAWPSILVWAAFTVALLVAERGAQDRVDRAWARGYTEGGAR